MKPALKRGYFLEGTTIKYQKKEMGGIEWGRKEGKGIINVLESLSCINCITGSALMM